MSTGGRRISVVAPTSRPRRGIERHESSRASLYPFRKGRYRRQSAATSAIVGFDVSILVTSRLTRARLNPDFFCTRDATSGRNIAAFVSSGFLIRYPQREQPMGID